MADQLLYCNGMLGSPSFCVKNRVIQNFALLGSGASVAQGLMIINAIVLARYLAPRGYGLYIGTYSAVGLTSFLFNWGFDNWILRQGAITSKPSQLVGSVLIIKSVLGVSWGALLFFLLPALSPDLFLKPLVLVSVLDMWCEGLLSAQLATFSALKRILLVSQLMLFSRGGRLLGTVILIILGIQSPVHFAQARLLVTFTAFVIAIIALRPQFTTGVKSLLCVFSSSIPFGLSDLLAVIYLQADVTLLAVFLGEGHAVGLYAPASGLLNALFVFPLAGYSIMVPILTQLNENGKEKRHLQSVAIKMFLGFISLGAVLWFGLWASGRFLAELLLGSAYQTTGELLIILSPILFLKSVSFAGAAFLVAVGWQRYRVVAQAISAFVNISLNLLVISRLGVWGVAGVYVASETVLTIGYLWLTIKWFRVTSAL